MRSFGITLVLKTNIPYGRDRKPLSAVLCTKEGEART